MDFQPDVAAPPDPRDGLRAAARSDTPIRDEITALSDKVDAILARLDVVTAPAASSGTIVPGRTIADLTASERHIAACEKAAMEDRARRWADDNPGKTQPAAPAPEPLPPNTVNIDGLTRHVGGAKAGEPFFADGDNRTREVRQAEQREQFKTREKAEEAQRNAGLPSTHFRDHTMLVRDRKTGKVDPEFLPATFHTPDPKYPEAVNPVERPTAVSAPSVLPPHAEEVFAGQEPGATTSEDLEVLRLRQPDPVIPAGVAIPVERPNRDDSGDVPERPLSLQEQLERLRA
jgi:hypothetical protein